MSRINKKRIRFLFKFLLIYYLLALIYVCLLSEAFDRDLVSQSYRYNLVPLREIFRFYHYRETIGTTYYIANLFGNILAFMPLGFILPVIKTKKRKFIDIVLAAFALSLCIELTQLVLKVGAFDVDDLILNTLGGAVGYLAFRIVNLIRRYYGRKDI